MLPSRTTSAPLKKTVTYLTGGVALISDSSFLVGAFASNSGAVCACICVPVSKVHNASVWQRMHFLLNENRICFIIISGCLLYGKCNTL